jgi:hypothetical protein
VQRHTGACGNGGGAITDEAIIDAGANQPPDGQEDVAARAAASDDQSLRRSKTGSGLFALFHDFG